MNWRVERAVRYAVPAIAASALLALAGCKKSAGVEVEAPEYSKVVKGTELARMTSAPYVPGPITRRHPTKVIVHLEVKELKAEIADGGARSPVAPWFAPGDAPGDE